MHDKLSERGTTQGLKEILVISPPDGKCYSFHKYFAYKINNLNNSVHLCPLLAGSGM